MTTNEWFRQTYKTLLGMIRDDWNGKRSAECESAMAEYSRLWGAAGAPILYAWPKNPE
ncbi:MAG: hypothetical protein PHO67_08440 [Candidatus Omnitrophica bacterium]|nr:hypothetical protein [Candidatus Omnitrophota bacterium]